MIGQKNLSFIALVIFLIKQWMTLSKRKKAIETWWEYSKSFLFSRLWFLLINFSRVLPTTRVVYYAGKPIEVLVAVYCLNILPTVHGRK